MLKTNERMIQVFVKQVYVAVLTLVSVTLEKVTCSYSEPQFPQWKNVINRFFCLFVFLLLLLFPPLRNVMNKIQPHSIGFRSFHLISYNFFFFFTSCSLFFKQKISGIEKNKKNPKKQKALKQPKFSRLLANLFHNSGTKVL